MTPENLRARQRLDADGGAVALCDWYDVVFLHATIDPAILQPSIPFPLDLRNGQAFVSIVTFDQVNFRTPLLGGLPSPLIRPLASYPICNLRTYVRCGEDRGVYFIREWEPNPFSAMVVPLVYGLPQRVARIRYEHDRQHGRYLGHVTRQNRSLVLSARIDDQAPLEVAPPESLSAFLADRFTAFQHVLGLPMRFHIWHPEWRQRAIKVQVEDAALAQHACPWWSSVQLIEARYSPGVQGVQLGLPGPIPR